MNKCPGCGKLINDDEKYCQRCFNIKNYNKHDIKSNGIDNEMLLEKINNHKIFTIYLSDFLNLTNEFINYYNKITNDKIFVITKMDVIPKNVNLDKLINNIKNKFDIKNLMLLSIKNDYNLKNIINLIEDNKKVLIVGPTSSGKSSLINHIATSNITVSNYKNTTQDFINVKYNDSLIIDAPGFNSDYMIDNIKQNGYIKPKTISIKSNYELVINKYSIGFLNDVNITLYLPNNINIITRKMKNNYDSNIKINENSDLIINNLGFIYFKNSCNITINDLKGIDVRSSIMK